MSESNPNEADDAASESAFVYCRSCGSRASADWSYCRSCESSLENAVPPEGRRELAAELFDAEDLPTDERGCRKCGRADAVADILETTGVAVTPRIAAQNDRFRVVACEHCGYTEFFTHGDEEMLIELFLKG